MLQACRTKARTMVCVRPMRSETMPLATRPALALDRFSKVEKKYDPATEKQGKEFATLQWVCYGSGGALLTTGIIVGASGGSSSSAVALVPAVGPGLAGATLSGSF